MGCFCSLHWSMNIISLVKYYNDSLKYNKRKLWFLSIMSFFSWPSLIVPKALCYWCAWGVVQQRSTSLGLLKPSMSQVGSLMSVMTLTAQRTASWEAFRDMGCNPFCLNVNHISGDTQQRSFLSQKLGQNLPWSLHEADQLSTWKL